MKAGQTLSDLNRLEEAVEMFNTALEIEPDNQEVLSQHYYSTDNWARHLSVSSSSVLHS